MELTLKLCGALVAIGLLALPASALAQDLTFVLTNDSSYTLKAFYTSPADVGEWEADVFGDSYLPAGNQVNVTVSDARQNCVYDMKFVMEDDSEFVEKDIDLCDLGEYTLSDAE